MDVHGLVTHITYDDFVLVSIELALLACLTVWTLPWESLYQVSIQRRLVTSTMVDLRASKAFH